MHDIEDSIRRHANPPELDPWHFVGALFLLASASAVLMGAIAAVQWL